MSRNLRVVIADDNEHFRTTVVAFLNSRLYVDVVGEAIDGEHVIDLVRSAKPDLVLMDIRMPKRNGIECTRLIKDMLPSTRVIILTLHDASVYRQLSTEAGADAFIPKSTVRYQLDKEIARFQQARSAKA